MTDKNDLRLQTARQNIRIAAAMRGVNLSEVSRQAGMSRNSLGQYVAGRTSLSYANMLRVCDVLQLPISLVHRQDSMTEGRIRVWRALERLPAHLTDNALNEIKNLQS